jgi:hypothetical protein
MLLTACGASHDSQRAVVAPQSEASKATRVAQVRPHTTAAPSAVVTPHSAASEAARAAGAESRKVIIPKIRDVPASGVTIAPRAVSALPTGVPYASDTDPVRIVSFAISSTVFHPGDDVTGDVVTTSNVASVTAQVGSIRVAVPRVAPGRFHLSLQLPSVPLPPGSAELVISAIRKDGTATTRSVPITVEL